MAQTWRQYLAQLAAPQPDRVQAPGAPQRIAHTRLGSPLGVGANRPALNLPRTAGLTQTFGFGGRPDHIGPGMDPPTGPTTTTPPPTTPPPTGLPAIDADPHRPGIQVPGPSKPPPPAGDVPDDQLGLPLSPEFEAGRRAIEDQLAASLAQIGTAREQIPTMLQFITTRLANDEAESLRQVDEALNARGIYRSGIRAIDRDRTSLGFDRSRQDLAQTAAGQYTDLATQESAAQMQYQRDLAALLMAIANAQAQDTNTAVPTPESETAPNAGDEIGKPKRTKKKKKKGKR